MPVQTSITSSNRTASSVTLNGSGFTLGAQYTEITLNGVVIAGTDSLTAESWTVTISITSSANTYVFNRYREDIDADLVLSDTLSFFVPAYIEPFKDSITGKTMKSFSSGTSSMRRRFSSRKRFPKV